jgi:hypothetical protein
VLHYTEKLIIFITGLHNKPQGCGAPIASAAEPFTTTTTTTHTHTHKKKKTNNNNNEYPITGQPKWGLVWTKWYCRFLSQYFGSPVTHQTWYSTAGIMARLQARGLRNLNSIPGRVN